MSRLISELDTALAQRAADGPYAAHAPFLLHQDEFFTTFDDFADGR